MSNEDRPNILFITTDYQSGEDGPSLGSPFLDMPGLDRLCRDGVVFERHYSTAPVCMPERFTWVSGQYPHTHGKWGNGPGWFREGTTTLMEALGRHGYYSLGVGKMHFDPWHEMGGFDRRIIADRKANIDWDAIHQDDYAKFLQTYGLTRWDYLKISYESETPHVYDWPFPEERHIDHYVGEQAVKVVESGELDDKENWFMWVSFNGPHNPWDPPAKYKEPYLKMDLPKPRRAPKDLEEGPMFHTGARYGYTREVADYIDEHPELEDRYIQEIRAAHYANLTLIDRGVERVLNALEAKGQLEDTIVIYSADHGALLGDHGAFHKGQIFERSARVPFVVHCPKRFQAKRTAALCGGVDLMPTILSLVRAPIPKGVEGTDLTPLLTGAKESITDETFIELGGNIGVVTDRWKFYFHHNAEGELFDLENDPDELVNLYNNPEYSEIREEMKQRLIEFHPEFAEGFEKKPPEPPDWKDEYHFNQGDVWLQGRQPYPPYQAGKRITVRVRVSCPNGKPCDGPLFTCEEDLRSWPRRCVMHGYSLFIKDGKPAMAVRHWNEDTVIAAETPLPGGESEVGGTLERNGAFSLKVNGEIVATGKAPGALPARPGRRELLAPSIHVGVGHKERESIGDYDHEKGFTGQMTDVILNLED